MDCEQALPRTVGLLLKQLA